MAWLRETTNEIILHYNASVASEMVSFSLGSGAPLREVVNVLVGVDRVGFCRGKMFADIYACAREQGFCCGGKHFWICPKWVMTWLRETPNETSQQYNASVVSDSKMCSFICTTNLC